MKPSVVGPFKTRQIAIFQVAFRNWQNERACQSSARGEIAALWSWIPRRLLRGQSKSRPIRSADRLMLSALATALMRELAVPWLPALIWTKRPLSAAWLPRLPFSRSAPPEPRRPNKSDNAGGRFPRSHERLDH